MQAAPGWILDDHVSPTATLRQGDLVRFPDEGSPLRRAGIVITADCDLENKKHANLVTLIPVVSAPIILEYYLIPEDCERKRNLILNYAIKALSIDSAHQVDIQIAMIESLSKDNDMTGSLRVAVSFLLDRMESIEISAYKNLMKSANTAPRGFDAFQQQIRSRGDLLVLPETGSFGIAAGIAWVRHIWQVHITQVAIRTSEVPSRSGERIARLDSPYRYRLTQLMGQVFSDIGLPTGSDSVSQALEEAYRNE